MLRPKYLIIAQSALGAMQIQQAYEKKKLFANFDLDVAFTGCQISKIRSDIIVFDPYMRELRDPIIRYRWYMPKDAKVEVDTQYGSMWEARETLKRLSVNKYDAIINACEPDECGVAKFWYMLDEVWLKPEKVINLPIGLFWEDETIEMMLLTLNNRN